MKDVGEWIIELLMGITWKINKHFYIISLFSKTYVHWSTDPFYNRWTILDVEE